MALPPFFASPERPPGVLTRGWAVVRPILAGGAKRALRGLEALLHPWRRSTARRRLQRQRPVGQVLVLCYGNICRSPYAAATLQDRCRQRGLSTVVTQGGFFGPDRPANERGKEVAYRRGVDLSGHRSRLITVEDTRGSGLVVVMEAYQARKVVARYGAAPERVLVLGDLDPQTVESRGIPDPYGLEVAVFDRTYDRIDRCVLELARLLDPAGG